MVTECYSLEIYGLNNDTGNWTLDESLSLGCLSYYVDPTVDFWGGANPCYTDYSSLAGGGYVNPFIGEMNPYLLIEVNNNPSIKLADYIKCFGTLPDSGATYKVQICADLPVSSESNALLNGTTPGHAFLIPTKTNGTASTTQSFEFYPSDPTLSFVTYVPSVIKDDAGHEYNASYTLNNVSELEFKSILNGSVSFSTSKYSLFNYNCTNYALRVFNFILPNTPLQVPNWIGPSTNTNYGTTPNACIKY